MIPLVSETVVLPKPELTRSQISGYNEQIGDSALETQNVDKGFAHCATHFKPEDPVNAALHVEQGWFGEYGWAAFFEQGRHRCVLTGVLSGRRPMTARSI
jgi:hypothetical protein